MGAADQHHQAMTPMLSAPPKKRRVGWIAGGLGLLLVIGIAAAGGASTDDIATDSEIDTMIDDSFEEALNNWDPVDSSTDDLEWDYVANTCEKAAALPEVRAGIDRGMTQVFASTFADCQRG